MIFSSRRLNCRFVHRTTHNAGWKRRFCYTLHCTALHFFQNNLLYPALKHQVSIAKTYIILITLSPDSGDACALTYDPRNILHRKMKVTFVPNFSIEANGRTHSFFSPTCWLTIVAKCKAAIDNRTSIIWGLIFVTNTVGFFPGLYFLDAKTWGTKTLLRNILIGCS